VGILKYYSITFTDAFSNTIEVLFHWKILRKKKVFSWLAQTGKEQYQKE
jgi:hypothetical protein